MAARSVQHATFVIEQTYDAPPARVFAAFAGAGTKLTFTEQDAFLDGYDDAASREAGTRWLLGELGKAVEG